MNTRNKNTTQNETEPFHKYPKLGADKALALFRASTKNACSLFDIRPLTWHFKTSAHGVQGHTIAFERKTTLLQQRQESVTLLFTMLAVILKWWLVSILLSLQKFQYWSFGKIYMGLQHRTLSLRTIFVTWQLLAESVLALILACCASFLQSELQLRVGRRQWIASVSSDSYSIVNRQ